MLAGSVTLDATWLLLGGFLLALGTAGWKFIPWVVKTAIVDVIDEELSPKLDEVHRRIDEHMALEDESMVTSAEAMASIDDQVKGLKHILDERTALFGEVRSTMEHAQKTLAEHMAADEAQFKTSGAALVAGQRALLERLAAIEAAVGNQTSLAGDSDAAAVLKGQIEQARDELLDELKKSSS